MRYDAVIFDLFGTLVDLVPDEELARAYDRAWAEMADHLGAVEDDFRRAWRATRPERDCGRLGGLEEEIAHVCGGLGLRPAPEQVAAAARARLELYRRALAPRAGAVEVLTTLRAMGLRIGLISDCGSEVPRLWPETPFAPLVGVPLFSCAAGRCKPDPAIYRMACERLQVPPERCLYVGDGGSGELTGAAAMGMTPILIRAENDGGHDPTRADALAWQATRISHLRQVLAHVTGEG